MRFDFLQNDRRQNQMFNFTRGSTTTVEAAAAQYDFIFVNERMDESLVVFMLDYGFTFRYGFSKRSWIISTLALRCIIQMEKLAEPHAALLSFRDIVYLSAKNRTGLYKTAADMPAELNAYIMEHNELDLQLWDLAKRKLNERIARLEAECGSGIVVETLAKFKRVQALVLEECSEYHVWYKKHGFGPPFSRYSDNGIAPRCLDFVTRYVGV
jgi:hypothetical protein